MLQTDSKTLLALQKQIAAGRKKLQDLYNAHGATTPEVLAAGIELDKLLNEYERKR
jgi:hypothetical protein